MEAATLTSNLTNISSLGVGLNQTQQSALNTSLLIAEVRFLTRGRHLTAVHHWLKFQANYKFTGLRFWGKISGIKEDYFIVYGINKDELNERKFLYR